MFLESGSSEVLADILEVVAALGHTYGLSFSDLVEMAEKRKDRGGFWGRIVLLSVEG